jgi:SOS-response transcriptional repressor LexA
VRGNYTKTQCNFQEGEIITVNPQVETKPGDFVIIKNDEEKATLKQLKRYGDMTILHPLNPKYADIEINKVRKYQIIGKVVEKKRY